jgi:hypothetical protein
MPLAAIARIYALSMELTSASLTAARVASERVLKKAALAVPPRRPLRIEGGVLGRRFSSLETATLTTMVSPIPTEKAVPNICATERNPTADPMR